MATSIVLGGIAMPGFDANGCRWRLTGLDGWAGAPAASLVVTQNPAGSGGWSGESFQAPRQITLSGMLYAPNADALRLSIDSLNAAIGLDDTQLVVTEGMLTRSATIRQLDIIEPIHINQVVASWSALVSADDSRKLGAPITLSTVLPSTSGGRAWATAWPLKWTGVSASGIVSIFNPGNVAGPIMVRIDGPAPPPIITHLTSGAQLVFSSSLSLGTGEFLTIDMEKQEVLANGQVTRAPFVTSRGYFSLDPGANDIAFNTSGTYLSTATMTVTAYPAWK